MVPRSSSTPPHRLSDLTAAIPADRTLQNMLNVIASKLELCSRLPIFEYEAATEGHDAAAAAFHEMAERERRGFSELIASLRRHLDEMVVGDRREAEGGAR